MCHSGMGMRHRTAIARRAGHQRAGRAADAPARNPRARAFLEQYAKAEGTYRSARALVYEIWGEMSHLLERGERPGVRLQSLVRLAMAHVTWAAHDAAMFVYTVGGHDRLRAGTIQRLFRDMHAGTQHLIASPPVFRASAANLRAWRPRRRGDLWI